MFLLPCSLERITDDIYVSTDSVASLMLSSEAFCALFYYCLIYAQLYNALI